MDQVKAGYDADKVKDGKFQAMMEVALVNDGPVCVSCSCLSVCCCLWMMLTRGQVTLELQAGNQNNDKSD